MGCNALHCAFCRFYICYSGQMRSFRCAPGLFWDQRTQNCEKPHNSDCHVSCNKERGDEYLLESL